MWRHGFWFFNLFECHAEIHNVSTLEPHGAFISRDGDNRFQGQQLPVGKENKVTDWTPSLTRWLQILKQNRLTGYGFNLECLCA